MKELIRIVSVTLFTAVLFSPLGPLTCSADEYNLSNDPRLAEARGNFEKGLEFMEKGRKEFRRRPGQAQKLYEHAEDYFLQAGFLYRELGHRYGIDVSHEISVCGQMDREAHVMVNKSRKKWKLR